MNWSKDMHEVVVLYVKRADLETIRAAIEAHQTVCCKDDPRLAKALRNAWSRVQFVTGAS